MFKIGLLSQRPRGVHDGEVRHVHVCARHGGGVQEGNSDLYNSVFLGIY